MWASQVVVVVKNLPANAGDWGDPSQGQEDPLEEMATHSSILAWRIPQTRGAWWVTVRGVKGSQTGLKQLSTTHSFLFSLQFFFRK